MMKYTLRRAQEHKIEKRREQEHSREDLLRYFKAHKSLEHACQADEKSKVDAYRARARQRATEQRILDKLEQAEYDFAEKQRASAAAESAAVERDAAATSAERQAKERQLIINGSEQLQHLKALIQAARVKIERDAQCAQRAAQCQAESAEAEAFSAAQAEKLAQTAAQERDQELQRLLKGRAAQEALRVQLQYRQLLKEDDKDAAARERREADAAAEREDAEDALTAEALAARREAEQAFIQQYLADRKQTLLNRALDEAAETRRVEEYEELQREREARLEEQAALKKARADQRYESIKGRQDAEREAAEARQRMIDLLRAEELREAAEAAAAKRRERQRRQQQEMAESNRRQIELRVQELNAERMSDIRRTAQIDAKLLAEREAERKAADEASRQALLRQLADQDRLDQMNDQKRRLRLAQHKREVERLLAEKRRIQAAAEEAEAAERAATRAAEERRDRVIEEERARLLAEAGDLLKYLPHAVLANEKKPEPLAPAFLD